MSDLEYVTNEALSGRTFYRGVAAPSRAGSYSYIGVMNPANSGVNCFLDAMYPWPGMPDWSTEYGSLHYNTPFDQAPFQDVYSAKFKCTKYGSPDSKTTIWLGTYPQLINPTIDYIFMCAKSQDEPQLQRFPYPLVILPGDGMVFWSTYLGHENKAGIWIREKPLV